MADTFEVKRGIVGFTIVTNSVLKDPDLSWQAKGLYSYLLSNTINWKIFKKEIENHATNGRESTANAWKELVSLGWITSVAKQENGKMAGWHHTVHCDLGRERPEKLPTDGKPVLRETRLTGNPQLIKNNNKKEQINKTNVSTDTLGEFWAKLRETWKISNSPVGTKSTAIKLISKLDLTDEILTNKLITQSRLQSEAVFKLNQTTKPDLSMPNVSTWISQRRWEQSVTDYYSTDKQSFKSPPGSAQPPRRRKVFGQD